MGLDVNSALSCREQIHARFRNAETFQEVVGEGERACIFPRLPADMQKKGKPASVCIQTGALWAQSSSEEIQVCKSSAVRFSCVADSACAALLHLCVQLSLQA